MRVRNLILLSFLAAVGGVVRPAAAQGGSPDWWERIRFSGDARIRHEGFYQSGAEARNRFRFRFRLGLTARIDSSWRVGFRIASGNPDNITSTNQSLDGLFDRKSISIDRAFVEYAPPSFLGSGRQVLTITAGKFSPQHFLPSAGMGSELVLDGDLTVEGFHEEVSALERREGALRQISFHGDQWILDEVGSDEDAWMLGGQAVGVLALGRTTLTGSGGVMHYRNPERIARAANGNGELVISNAVRLQDGSVVDGGTPFQPDAGNPIVGFVNDFTVLTGSVQLELQGGGKPISVFVDAAHNADADQDNDALWVGGNWGRLRRIGDVRLAGAWARTEKESVVSALSYSDFGRSGGTNVQGVFLQVEVRAADRVTFSAKHHFVTLIRVPVGQSNPTLHRLQLNTAVSF